MLQQRLEWAKRILDPTILTCSRSLCIGHRAGGNVLRCGLCLVCGKVIVAVLVGKGNADAGVVGVGDGSGRRRSGWRRDRVAGVGAEAGVEEEGLWALGAGEEVGCYSVVVWV